MALCCRLWIVCVSVLLCVLWGACGVTSSFLKRLTTVYSLPVVGWLCWSSNTPKSKRVIINTSVSAERDGRERATGSLQRGRQQSALPSRHQDDQTIKSVAVSRVLDVCHGKKWQFPRGFQMLRFQEWRYSCCLFVYKYVLYFPSYMDL